jgi:hypothetical protein
VYVRRLLTFGDSPVIAVEQLDAEGQQLLQRGLQPPPLPAGAADAGLQQVQQQVGDLGLGLGSSDAAGGRQSEESSRSAGLELQVPKEVQRLVQFLQVRTGRKGTAAIATVVSTCGGLAWITAAWVRPSDCFVVVVLSGSTGAATATHARPVC